MPRPSTRASGLRAFTHASQAPTKASHYGQTRTFRFRAWSTYLDPEFQRQLRQRQRQVSYKYMESINRKLSWDPSSRAEDSRIVLKNMMAQCWIRHGHTHSKGTNVKDKVNSDDVPGTRPGQNIEDVERGAINALFSSKRTGSYEYDLWQSPLQNIRNYLGSQVRAKSTTSASRDAGVEIDPITNKRVQSDSPNAVHEPFYEDGPPPAEELKQYGQVPLDGTPWAESGDAGTPQYADLDKYTPVMDKTLDAKQLQQEVSEEPKYDDLEKYKPVGLEDFIEDAKPAPESKYDDLHKYANPSLTEGTPEELSQPAYEDLDKYRPVMHNEDAQIQGAVETYDDLNKYGPVMHNEGSDAAVEEKTAYDDLHKYGPSGFNEPEGARPLTEEERSKDYDDLHKYGPVGYNEPFGKAPIHPEEASKAYPDLDQYGPMAYNEPHGQAPMHPEEASKAYTDLGEYEPIGWNEPHGKPPMHPEEASKQYSDLNTYGPVAFARGDGQLPESTVAPIAPEDMAKHKPVQYNQPESQRPKPDWDQTTFDEAKKYQSYRYNEPHGQPIQTMDPVSKGLSDFDAEIAAKANMRRLNTYGTSTVEATATENERADDLDLLRASDIRAKIPTSSGQSRREYSTTHRQVLEDDLPRYEVNWDISSKAARVSLRKARSKVWDSIQPKEDLTGNYVRDFPEDFSKSWSKIITESPKAEDTKYQSPKGDEVEAASFDESFPRLEPAMNRASAFKPRESGQGSLDQYSTEPQGLELSYTEETGGKQTWPAYVRSYGTVSEMEANTTAAKPDLSEPVLYKILAYDPTMQSITSAETTSVVPNSAATPLSPADVLPRLSNPTKFFPYFSPLQKEGYEIVSGSGDVLVFRKVRDAEVDQSAAPVAQTPIIEKPTTYQAPKVNPIDMMGSDPVVPSAYSSSPTGFLNYDYPGAEAEDKPPPPSSPLRRRNTISCDNQDFSRRKPKRSRTRRVILGAAWLGGVSYAIGVVGEYFKTGGQDGRGPKGL
ncbi:hypothetical protein CkaCkLH20_07898 [Colletotrichum karsti]|uniref:Uncharacterized protein n=1 Tax=Colletotrichum karsti TaxID=1095194 RepID=A0A9P6I6B0_9PEZI|nr:uncharacterized protein CkaCkLH20_07898 [Colletotrichum karsti]KAF9874761.1 hypothetical protein CkaCkLH20_07898 [Colletotrichum karsti]